MNYNISKLREQQMPARPYSAQECELELQRIYGGQQPVHFDPTVTDPSEREKMIAAAKQQMLQLIDAIIAYGTPPSGIPEASHLAVFIGFRNNVQALSDVSSEALALLPCLTHSKQCLEQHLLDIKYQHHNVAKAILSPANFELEACYDGARNALTRMMGLFNPEFIARVVECKREVLAQFALAYIRQNKLLLVSGYELTGDETHYAQGFVNTIATQWGLTVITDNRIPGWDIHAHQLSFSRFLTENVSPQAFVKSLIATYSMNFTPHDDLSLDKTNVDSFFMQFFAVPRPSTHPDQEYYLRLYNVDEWGKFTRRADFAECFELFMTEQLSYHGLISGFVFTINGEQLIPCADAESPHARLVINGSNVRILNAYDAESYTYPKYRDLTDDDAELIISNKALLHTKTGGDFSCLLRGLSTQILVETFLPNVDSYPGLTDILCQRELDEAQLKLLFQQLSPTQRNQFKKRYIREDNADYLALILDASASELDNNDYMNCLMNKRNNVLDLFIKRLKSPLTAAQRFGYIDKAIKTKNEYIAARLTDNVSHLTQLPPDTGHTYFASLCQRHNAQNLRRWFAQANVEQLLPQLVNVPGRNGQTPLMVALTNQTTGFQKWRLLHRISGENMVTQDSQRNTLLHYLCMRPNLHRKQEIKRFTSIFMDPDFLRQQNINAANNNGYTALHLLVQQIGCSTELIKLLIDAGADITKLNQQGKRAVDLIPAIYANNQELKRLLTPIVKLKRPRDPQSVPLFKTALSRITAYCTSSSTFFAPAYSSELKELVHTYELSEHLTFTDFVAALSSLTEQYPPIGELECVKAAHQAYTQYHSLSQQADGQPAAKARTNFTRNGP